MHFLITGAGPRAELLAATLRAAGHPVLVVADGPAAAAALAAPGFDAVVLDLTLPEIDRERLLATLAPDIPSPPDSLDDAERRHIAVVLRHTRGNRREAARILGIARSTLLQKIRRYALDGPAKPA